MASFEKRSRPEVFDKIEYIDELILKLQILYSKNIVDDDFFDRALELLEQEKIDVYSHNINIQDQVCIDRVEEIHNFEDMSEEEKKKYIEIEKKGIKMRLLEAGNFSELDILYSRIAHKFINIRDELDDTIKIEFTRNFEKLFKSSYVYYFIDDYKKRYGAIDINNLVIDCGELKLKNNQYKFMQDSQVLKRQRIRKIDNDELNSLKTIINDVYPRFTDEFIENKLMDIIKLPKRQVSSKERIQKIKKTIEKILNIDDNRFFRSPISIDSDLKFNEKLQKCKNTYVTEFKGEIPLLIFDNTIFKTCEKGFMITDKTFYFKNESENTYSIDIDEIDNINLQKNDLYVNDKILYCDIIKQDYREPFADTITIIVYLIQNGLDSSKDIDLVIEEVILV